ncbi:MAG: ribose 5-phosphate isomerase B [Acinetobacter sp.]
MKIALGADHRGYEIKEVVKQHLLSLGYEVTDFGCFSTQSVNYVDYACKVAFAVSQGVFERGILLCNDGLGMSIVANKVPKIRCALCVNAAYAKISREHNDSNILAFGQMISPEDARAIVDAWLNTSFEGGRHIPRLQQISRLEQDMIQCNKL